MAGDTIDDIGDTFATVDGRASRKRNLLEGPEEFDRFRIDRFKPIQVRAGRATIRSSRITRYKTAFSIACRPGQLSRKNTAVADDIKALKARQFRLRAPPKQGAPAPCARTPFDASGDS